MKRKEEVSNYLVNLDSKLAQLKFMVTRAQPVELFLQVIEESKQLTFKIHEIVEEQNETA